MSSTSATARAPVPPLPPSLRERLILPRALAREQNVRLYLAGGAVRDFLLGLEVKDVDLVVEGDALAFAERAARAGGGRARLHPRFGTATVELPDAGRIDVARARRETYAHAGALPRVEPGSIGEDLARRDFTVNAMALKLEPARRPTLLDPFHGRDDLARRLIRMLHPRSPEDDVTRGFRAARYANRLGFRIEPKTRAWVRAAIAAGAASRVSGDRIRREVQLLFSEPKRAAAVRLLDELGLAAVVHPDLPSDAAVRRRIAMAERLAAAGADGTTWFLYVLVWACGLSAAAARELAERLNLDRRQRRTLAAWRETRKRLLRFPRESRAPARFSPDELAAAAACARSADRAVLGRALSGGAGRLTIGGRDLVAAGVRSGPAIGTALERTRAALGEGRIGPHEELEFALAIARRESL